MDEPSLRNSRLALAGGIAVALAVGGAGFLTGRATSPRSKMPAAAAPVAPPAVRATAAPPAPGAAVMTRADLIALAAHAADASASGAAMPKAVADAVGQRFDLRLAFGCQGPANAESDATMRWRYDEKAGALRVHVAPSAWSSADVAAAGAQPRPDDRVEGFWIPRPWTGSETCPAQPDSPAPVGSEAVTLPGQTLAIVQVFDDDAARQRPRGGKPYETVVRATPEEVRTGQGLQLRIRGRIAEIPGRGPIDCRQPAGPEQRPICLVAVTMDDVAVDNPATGRTLATWGVATTGAAEQ